MFCTIVRFSNSQRTSKSSSSSFFPLSAALSINRSPDFISSGISSTVNFVVRICPFFAWATTLAATFTASPNTSPAWGMTCPKWNPVRMLSVS